MSAELSAADQAHRAEMKTRLRHAADHFSVTLVGEPVFSGQDRTVGSRAKTPDGECWLRVSWSHGYWVSGEFWTGNQDAAALVGVPKPALIGEPYDWEEPQHVNRAEMMTLVTDRTCSTTEELRSALDLPDRWWTDLRAALDTLAAQHTERGTHDQDVVTRRLLAFFGGQIDPVVTAWVPAHGDLNWTNLTRPNLVLLDWESWGVKIAGYDAATLYVLALRAPDTAMKVRQVFADILDSPDGVRAQLMVISRYLRRVDNGGEFMDYADHLHRHAQQLIDHATRDNPGRR
jgi:hypothetical protein